VEAGSLTQEQANGGYTTFSQTPCLCQKIKLAYKRTFALYLPALGFQFRLGKEKDSLV